MGTLWPDCRYQKPLDVLLVFEWVEEVFAVAVIVVADTPSFGSKTRCPCFGGCYAMDQSDCLACGGFHY